MDSGLGRPLHGEAIDPQYGHIRWNPVTQTWESELGAVMGTYGTQYSGGFPMLVYPKDYAGGFRLPGDEIYRGVPANRSVAPPPRSYPADWASANALRPNEPNPQQAALIEKLMRLLGQ